MAAPAGPFKFHPAAGFTPTGVKAVPLTLSGNDVDLTAPAGVTGGYMGRWLLIGAAGGTLVYYDMAGAGPITLAVGASQLLPLVCSQVASTTNGTTVAVTAIL